jgi:vacuolar-type H+-ATPase subunit E/Vma4
MDEQNNNVETPQSIVERAEAAAKAIKEQNDRHEELIKREEENRAKSLLGGVTNSGQSQPQKSDEEIKKEKAMEFWKGTGIDKSIEKYG